MMKREAEVVPNMRFREKAKVDLCSPTREYFHFELSFSIDDAIQLVMPQEYL